MKTKQLQHITHRDRLYEARLRRLANHLLLGRLGHEYFDFNYYNSGGKPYKCGTAGCAIGECPIAFPRDWRFDKDGSPTLKRKPGSDTFMFLPEQYAGKHFFGIDSHEYYYLFTPRSSFETSPVHRTRRNDECVRLGKSLGPNASKDTVAKRIVKFCDQKYGKQR